MHCTSEPVLLSAIQQPRICCAARDLSAPGELTMQQTFQAEFANVEMQYDSHRGIQVRLR